MASQEREDGALITITPDYVEESFGILTDDELYLDCILVKPVNLQDEALKALRVWVPKYPLTKSSVITCARQEVKSYGPDSKIAHLVFDLRSTGDSDGMMGDDNFQLDLAAVADWADERFGKINFGFLGFPSIDGGKVNVWPLRAGSVVESYYYYAANPEPTAPSVLYLSSYGKFSRQDEATCIALADAGYDVYGLDPYRYLLHASLKERLTPDHLRGDIEELAQMLRGRPIIISEPLSAGLALMWASLTPQVRGVIAIGRAQSGLAPKHIFNNDNPYSYLLTRHIIRIAPRPVVLVHLEGHANGGKKKNVAALFQASQPPHRLERVAKITPQFLMEMIEWVAANEE